MDNQNGCQMANFYLISIRFGQIDHRIQGDCKKGFNFHAAISITKHSQPKAWSAGVAKLKFNPALDNQNGCQMANLYPITVKFGLSDHRIIGDCKNWFNFHAANSITKHSQPKACSMGVSK